MKAHNSQLSLPKTFQWKQLFTLKLKVNLFRFPLLSKSHCLWVKRRSFSYSMYKNTFKNHVYFEGGEKTWKPTYELWRNLRPGSTTNMHWLQIKVQATLYYFWLSLFCFQNYYFLSLRIKDNIKKFITIHTNYSTN